jgi:hypothetical protein
MKALGKLKKMTEVDLPAFFDQKIDGKEALCDRALDHREHVGCQRLADTRQS